MRVQHGGGWDEEKNRCGFLVFRFLHLRPARLLSSAAIMRIEPGAPARASFSSLPTTAVKAHVYTDLDR